MIELGSDIMNHAELAAFFHKIGGLKEIKRSGWVRIGITDPESVADHSFRTAFMAMILGDFLEMDALKLMRMALIHDLAEVLVGDITPYDGLTKIEKHGKEEISLKQLLRDIPNGHVYMELWKEYEQQKSQEAIILRNIDKLEMAFQASEYKQAFPDKDISEFIFEADRHIDIPDVRVLYDEVKKESKPS